MIDDLFFWQYGSKQVDVAVACWRLLVAGTGTELVDSFCIHKYLFLRVSKIQNGHNHEDLDTTVLIEGVRRQNRSESVRIDASDQCNTAESKRNNRS